MSITWAYKDAYNIATENEDELRAWVFVERVYSALCLIKGDNNLVMVKMKQAAEELSAQTPQRINKAKFKNWLWMLNWASES